MDLGIIKGSIHIVTGLSERVMKIFKLESFLSVSFLCVFVYYDFIWRQNSTNARWRGNGAYHAHTLDVANRGKTSDMVAKSLNMLQKLSPLHFSTHKSI